MMINKTGKNFQKYIIFIFSFILFLISPFFILGQTGVIKGYVTDSITNEPLVGATIRIDGLSKGAISGLDGDFVIGQLAEGNYQLKGTFFSYQTAIISSVPVYSGDTTTINILLNYEATDLEEVRVVAKVNRESETALLLEQKKSIAPIQNIGAQELSRKGVGDAESAVAKVSGVSKQENVKNVFIRGLEDRYNVTLLNELPIPSEDPEYKNIALEIFGTDIIQNIGIHKVFSARNTGDVGGAIININSKEMIKDHAFGVEISTGFNTEVIGKTFLKPFGSDYWGISQNQRPVSNQFDFVNNLDPFQVKLPLNQSYKISGGKKFSHGNNTLSVFAVASHKTAFSYTKEIVRNTNTAGIIYKDQIGSRYSGKINQLALANLKYDINNKHFIAYNFLVFHTNNEYIGEYSGRDTEKFQDSDAEMGYLRRQQTNDNRLFTHQLLSKWKLSDKLDLAADLSFNTIKGLEPDRRENYLSQKNDGTYGLTGSNRQKRFFSELSEQDYTSKLVFDYRLKDAYDNQISKISFGLNTYLSNNNFEAVEYNFNAVHSSLSLDNITLDNIYNSTNYQEDKFKMVEGDPNTYNVSKRIYSAFAESVYQLTKSFVGNIGFRLDYVNMDVNYDVTGLLGTNSIVKPYYLPYLNLKYTINDKNALRLGTSKTYTLPQSKEISPYQYVDIGFASEGNPNLQPSDNYHADLKWDYYFSPSEILSAAVFYKHIVNPIGRVDKGNSAGLLTYDNISEYADVTGIEFELRKNLYNRKNDASESTNKLTLGFNASYIFSKLKLNLTNTPERISRLEGASPLIVNFDMTYLYTKEKHSYMTALVFNYFSDKIYTNGTMGFKDIIEKGVPTVDYVFSYTLKNKFGIKLKAANLLNPSFMLVRESSVSEDKIVLNQYKKGVNINFGISFNL